MYGVCLFFVVKGDKKMGSLAYVREGGSFLFRCTGIRTSKYPGFRYVN